MYRWLNFFKFTALSSFGNVRLKTLLKRFLDPDKIEAGCDEAGRGCLAGPVCSAAVILPSDFHDPELNDSKQLNIETRERLRMVIENVALAYGVTFIDNLIIDEINILRASILGMHHALDKLTIRPDHIVVDGNKFFRYRDIPHTCVVKGDAIYTSVAAASVLAKTYRDEYMKKLHTECDCYGWDMNKGYATKLHRAAIVSHGLSIYHRRSFQLFNTQMEIDFKENSL